MAVVSFKALAQDGTILNILSLQDGSGRYASAHPVVAADGGIVHDAAMLQHNVLSAGSSGDNTVQTHVAGQTLRIYQMIITATAAVTVIVKDGSGSYLAALYLAAGAPLILPYTGRPWFTCALAEDFIFNLGAGSIVVGGSFDFTST